MTAQQIIIAGIFYDGITPEMQQRQLSVDENKLRLSCKDFEKEYPRDSVMVSPRIGGADRFVSFVDGGQYQCKDSEILNQLSQESSSEGIVAWFESHLAVAMVSIVLVVSSLCLGYFYGLPVLADKVVNRVPVTAEESLGEYILNWLDTKEFFTYTKIPLEKRNKIETEFGVLIKDLRMRAHIRLMFRNSEIIGANALALPGGAIVITDELINLARSDEEIMAILAHEVGHVENRRAMRNILQNSMVALATASITADVSMVGGAAASLPVIFLQTSYSRDFEREADDFAVKLLQLKNISPGVFADILERIEEKQGMITNQFDLLSTHPVTEERVNKIRQPSFF